MSIQLIAWIRQVATLSDTALEEELELFNNTLSMHLQESLNAVSFVINSDTLVSPVPYTMSHIWTHMDTNATIKNQLSFTSPSCQPTIVLMDQRTNAKSPAHQTVYWT
ncbi:hypothetical protein BDEG_23119 [Batrachochytrium dendrobatidis JEL423]|uniref:Uncharacterized protein n=1 Tax=Batrachochytrium dendrobatidis (strain JEL423) TaxID=403673 RepID=A0A177WGM3_BATDL|nr:hypothetical protein BDEG_23119 [Batrachochytrium dendrobatidis JEL423]